MNPAQSKRSRVFRQVATVEIFWLVDQDHEPPFADWDGALRDGIQGDTHLEPNGYAVPGEIALSEIEEWKGVPQ